MTLVLRLYDEAGTEIAWVTSDSFQYEVVHPDPETWSHIELMLDDYETVMADPDEPPAVETEWGRLYRDPGLADLTEREHLERIQSELSDYVGKAEIVDE